MVEYFGYAAIVTVIICVYRKTQILQKIKGIIGGCFPEKRKNTDSEILMTGIGQVILIATIALYIGLLFKISPEESFVFGVMVLLIIKLITFVENILT